MSAQEGTTFPLPAINAMALPVTSSQLGPAQKLWQHIRDNPPSTSLLHPSLTLHTSPITGLGLSVAAALPPHTLLLRLPPSVHLRPDPAIVGDGPASSDPFLSLVLTLLHHLHSSSPSLHSSLLSLHLSSLPTAFDLPYFWTPSQLAYLSGTGPVLHPLADPDSDYALYVRPFLSAHPELPALTLLDYKRALATVSSRGFRDGDGLPCLVPLLDFCNTRSGAKGDRVSGYVGWNDEGDVLLFAGADGLSAGEEVTIEYGEERSNASLLQRYGFVLADNAEDVADIDVHEVAALARDLGASVRVRNADPDLDDDDDVEDFVEELSVEFLPLRSQQPMPPLLLHIAAAFLGHIPKEELTKHEGEPDCYGRSLPLRVKGKDGLVRDDDASAAKAVVSSSVEVTLRRTAELDALRVLYMALMDRGPACATPAEDDEAELKREEEKRRQQPDGDDEESRRRRMALLLRLSERAIVHEHLQQSLMRIKDLTSGACPLSSDESGVDDGDDDEDEKTLMRTAARNRSRPARPLPAAKKTRNA